MMDRRCAGILWMLPTIGLLAGGVAFAGDQEIAAPLPIAPLPGDVAAITAEAGVNSSQPAAAPGASGRQADSSVLPAPSGDLVGPYSPPGRSFWASGETLLWWQKSAPLPPTLTTFAAGSPSASAGFGGALGNQGTTVLSPDHLGYDMDVGGRFSLGYWLDDDQQVGIEASGFFLGTQTATFSAASNGSTPLRVPFVNVPPGDGFPLGESSFVLADPAFASGGQTVTSQTQFWGVEGNVLLHAVVKEQRTLSLLAGFRYLDLQENLSIVSTENLIGGAGSFTGTDLFGTRNQFYGGQLGLQSQSRSGRFDSSLMAKVALGDNYQTATVNGYNNVTGFGLAQGTTPGGIFAQSTNIGQRYRNDFCVVPEVQLQLGYNLSRRIRAFVGYDFLYMTDAVRPGNQIDRTLNFTSNAAISGVAPPATLVGAPRPEPQFNGSGFWAQGINLGIALTF